MKQPARAGRTKAPGPVVWVPPGSNLVASPGVVLLPMEGGVQVTPAAGQAGIPAESSWPPASVRHGSAKMGAAPERAAPERAAPEKAMPQRAVPQRATPSEPSRIWEQWLAASRPGSLPAGRESQEWDEAESVPPEIDALAEQVMACYDMKVTGRRLITTKPDKGGAIWRIETNRGPRSLKLLHRLPDRSRFSVGAQAYLVEQGARVPPLVAARDGQLSVEWEGKLWIVTDWIDELVQAPKVDLAGAEALCYGLGEFHRLSQGYLPPQGARKASRLFRWPRAYQKMGSKLDWFANIARAYREMPASPTLLSMLDTFKGQASAALERLSQSPYADLISRGEPAWGLVHQDYGWSNGQVGPGGIWIIDLDGVAYDLPIRDLRKLITSTMDDMGQWDLTWMRGMIAAYHEANPIEPDLARVLLIDMSLPNEFYKLVNEMVVEPELFLNAELDSQLHRLEQVERSKWEALAELGLDRAEDRLLPAGRRGGGRL